MTIQDIASVRLQQQGILGRHTQSPLECVTAMGAMQAQDYTGTLWAIGLRTGLTEQQVIKHLENQDIIRCWPQRGTIHVVSARDAPWHVGLSAERMIKSAARRRQNLGITDEMLVQSRTIIQSLLHNQLLLPRQQLLDALQQANVATDNGRGYHLLWHLSQTGLIYIGPMEGKQQTFGLFADLSPQPHKPDRTAAVTELTKRYFTSHGPATAQDFMWWSGLTAADAKAGIAANNQALRSEVIDGKTYWLDRNVTAVDVSNTAFLLPGFDEYILGYKDRSAVLAAEHSAQVVPGSNGMFMSSVVIGGQVVGVWKRMRKSKAIQIQITPFHPLPQTDKQLLQAPAEAYAAFIGLPLQLDIA